MCSSSGRRSSARMSYAPSSMLSSTTSDACSGSTRTSIRPYVRIREPAWRPAGRGEGGKACHRLVPAVLVPSRRRVRRLHGRRAAPGVQWLRGWRSGLVSSSARRLDRDGSGRLPHRDDHRVEGDAALQPGDVMEPSDLPGTESERRASFLAFASIVGGGAVGYELARSAKEGDILKVAAFSGSKEVGLVTILGGLGLLAAGVKAAIDGYAARARV